MPNLHDQWGSRSWVQQDLVARFIEIYLPLAEQTQAAGLIPVFPPLKRGGDYWDTAFLRAALQMLKGTADQRQIDRFKFAP